MLYTVVMGVYNAPIYWQSGWSFTEVVRETVEAPSAGDARARVEVKYPKLVFERVTEPTAADITRMENLARVSSPAYKRSERAVAKVMKGVRNDNV